MAGAEPLDRAYVRQEAILSQFLRAVLDLVVTA